MPAKRHRGVILYGVLCCLQTLQFIRFYSVSPTFYLSMPAYLAGHERNPFQQRILPIFFLKPLFESRWVTQTLAHSDGPFTAQRGPIYLLSLISFMVAAVFVQKLYSSVTQSGSLYFLVFPVFLFAAMWSYVIHTEANFSFPYDLPSLAFFAAGLYFVYARKYVPLLIVMFFGTLNRETTLFLVGIYILDAATVPNIDAGAPLRHRISLSKVSWMRVAALVTIWLAVKITVAHIFAHNNDSENYVRLASNLGRLKLRLWPALLNVCGYLLPVVWIYRKRIAPVRFSNYLYILPFWIVVMFYTGVIVETRIYGELCSYVAVAIVVLGEQYVASLTAPPKNGISRSSRESSHKSGGRLQPDGTTSPAEAGVGSYELVG